MVLPKGFSWKDIRPKVRFLLIVCGVVIVANMLPTGYYPHYSAPITGAILALVLVAMQDLSGWQHRQKPAGLFTVRAVPCICVLLLALRAAAGPLHLPVTAEGLSLKVPDWCWQTASNPARAAILTKLRKDAGGQLVIVHYTADHDPANEWVYNRADLGSAKVIWARDMGPRENEILIRYFKHRRVWLLCVDDQSPKLLPYTEAADLRASATGSKAP
jgi:hypothetical protein